MQVSVLCLRQGLYIALAVLERTVATTIHTYFTVLGHITYYGTAFLVSCVELTLNLLSAFLW